MLMVIVVNVVEEQLKISVLLSNLTQQNIEMTLIDGRGGGCRMSWMLSVPANAPQWFRDIQLCYKWHPDGDGGQCGGGVGRELCARTNDWTTYYRDDTDGRGGGCQMAWSLKSTP